MDFVWQYLYKDSFWGRSGIFNELEYSIKSVKKFGPDPRCIVVGDKPPVSFGDIIHIPAPPFPEQHPSKQRQTVDKTNKMEVMATHPDIGDEFVIMYDDVFLLKPTTVDDLKINWARQEITYIEEYMQSGKRTGDRSYREMWRSTYEFIKMIRDEREQKTYDWETHTPRYFEKSKLNDLFRKFDFEYNPKLVQALYDGFHAHNTQIINDEIQTDLWSHEPGMDFVKLLDVQYLNIYDNVIVPEFVEQLKKILV